jgi:hypothetical protein
VAEKILLRKIFEPECGRDGARMGNLAGVAAIAVHMLGQHHEVKHGRHD